MAKSLQHKLTDSFFFSNKREGQVVFDTGAVHLVFDSRERKCAYVDEYQVAADASFGAFYHSCDCALHERYQQCKHVWAFLVYCDRNDKYQNLLKKDIHYVSSSRHIKFEEKPSLLLPLLQKYSDKPLKSTAKVAIDKAKKAMHADFKDRQKLSAFFDNFTALSSDVNHAQALAESFSAGYSLAFRIHLEEKINWSVQIEPFLRKSGGATESKGKELTRAEFNSYLAEDPKYAPLLKAYPKSQWNDYYESNTYSGSKYTSDLDAKTFASFAPVFSEEDSSVYYKNKLLTKFHCDTTAEISLVFKVQPAKEAFVFKPIFKAGAKVLTSIKSVNNYGVFTKDSFYPLEISVNQFDLLGRIGLSGMADLSQGNAELMVNKIIEARPDLLNSLDYSVLDAVEFIKEIPKKEIHFVQAETSKKTIARVFFNYKEGSTQNLSKGSSFLSSASGAKSLRNVDYEAESFKDLSEAGCTYVVSREEITITKKNIAFALQFLSKKGWTVKAEGKVYRSLGKFSFSVASGLDWFDVKGEAELDNGEVINLSDIITKVKKGDNLVTFNDGSMGFIDDKTISKLVNFLNLGEKHEDGMRFKASQTLILDALLAGQEVEDLDEKFKEARGRLADFKDLKTQKVPKTFKGKLRPYQQEGFDWLHFCQAFNLGACLADDMGLGKTIQILCLLEERRVKSKGKKTSIVVVPTSLIFNWLSEVEKFALKLKVLQHTGAQRQKDIEALEKYDIVLTTYGLMRNDVSFLKDFNFDYAILDEAQAIKNSGTANAKGSRLLKADHKVIMSGTPVENHLGELWSLFEFINPGMLGRSKAFETFSTSDKDGESLKALSNALSPMIMRRTKALVADDLPDKTEQHLVCEMSPKQKKIYDDLKLGYKQSMEKAAQGEGILDNKIQVLEALLRLRQVACHPALIDEKYKDVESTKLTLMLEQIEEVMDEGHKVLIFSQFTSLLKIVKGIFDKKKLNYEYLDGSTRKREDRVQNFQENPDCRAFLISIKAGGTGLNLTAAEYVYILDPWWNPAVEAQAIDRAYRIGQKNHVFAYKMISKDTVEEKIMEMQKSKKELADSVIQSDGTGLKDMSTDDLKNLFS